MFIYYLIHTTLAGGLKYIFCDHFVAKEAGIWKNCTVVFSGQPYFLSGLEIE